MARFVNPPLTTVRFDRKSLGRMAFDILEKMSRTKQRKGSTTRAGDKADRPQFDRRKKSKASCVETGLVGSRHTLRVIPGFVHVVEPQPFLRIISYTFVLFRFLL